MKNTIYTDADLNAELLRGEEYNGNTIEIVIDADNTPDQVLTIAAGTTTIAETVTPGTRNTIDIPQMIWNFGGDTTATLTKDGTEAETITITFPAAIDAGAGLNENGTNAYKMDGSASLQEQIVSLQEQMQTFSMQTLDYILPKTISQADITDGSSNTALTFEFEVTDEGGRISLFTSLQFLAGTTVSGSIFDDLNVTGTIELDGNPIATILHTYRDGRQVFTLDYLVENLTKGNHTVTVAFAAAGGSMTVMQFLSAFMLAAKSTGGSAGQTMPLFTNGEWADGVLTDGLDPNKMTEQAMLNGIEDSIIKYSLADSNTGATPSVQTLSAYFNSSFVLCNGQYFAEPFYKTSEGYYRKQGLKGNVFGTSGRVGSTTVYFWIPIKRITGFTQLYFEEKCIKDNGTAPGATDYNLGTIGAGAIDNGIAQLVTHGSFKSQEWTGHTIDISALPYVDYIVLYGVDGSPGFRNIMLLK